MVSHFGFLVTKFLLELLVSWQKVLSDCGSPQFEQSFFNFFSIPSLAQGLIELRLFDSNLERPQPKRHLWALEKLQTLMHGLLLRFISLNRAHRVPPVSVPKTVWT